MERYLLEEWQQVEKELLRERSLWGPAAGSRLQRWMLDMTEGWFESLWTKAGSSVFMLYLSVSQISEVLNENASITTLSFSSAFRFVE